MAAINVATIQSIRRRRRANEPAPHLEANAVPHHLGRVQERSSAPSGDLEPVAVAWLRHRKPAYSRDGGDVISTHIDTKDRHIIAVGCRRVHSVNDPAALQLRLDIGHELLARPGLEQARPELGSARDSEGPSRAQNPGPLRVKSSSGSARSGPLARDIFFWPAMNMGSSEISAADPLEHKGSQANATTPQPLPSSVPHSRRRRRPPPRAGPSPPPHAPPIPRAAASELRRHRTQPRQSTGSSSVSVHVHVQVQTICSDC
jgi:hypothetical protein